MDQFHQLHQTSQLSDYYGGHIQLILGPMFAGKSTELLRRIKRYEVAKKKCLLIKYLHDMRYSKDCISTHDKQMVFALPSDTLAKVSSVANEYEVIGIDEGQFFPDLVDFCEKAANAGKIVIVSALDGTYLRKPFGSVLDLIPLSESVLKLNAVCMICGQDAAFTRRTTSETATEVIGGAEKYLACCRKCFMWHKSPAKSTIASSTIESSPQNVKKKKYMEVDFSDDIDESKDLNMNRNFAEDETITSPKKVKFMENNTSSLQQLQ